MKSKMTTARASIMRNARWDFDEYLEATHGLPMSDSERVLVFVEMLRLAADQIADEALADIRIGGGK